MRPGTILVPVQEMDELLRWSESLEGDGERYRVLGETGRVSGGKRGTR